MLALTCSTVITTLANCARWRLRRLACATAASPYATAYNYSSGGQVTGFLYGNGLCASYSFSPARLEMTSLSYYKPSTSGTCNGSASSTLFGLNYFYQHDPTNCQNGIAGNNGQIQCISDTQVPGHSESYTYDFLGRLSTEANSQFSLAWTYDRYGNRPQQNVTAGSWYSSQVTINQSNNQIAGFTYDASGNLTAQPSPASRAFTYDATGCETSFSGSGGSATYTCDGNGVRVKKAVSGGTSTVYIFSGGIDIAEYDTQNGNSPTPSSPSREFIYAGGSLVATLTNNSGTITTNYDHADHRSIRLITDANGNTAGTQGTDAYGEPWYSGTATTEFVYTSYQYDQESALYYAMARYYDPTLGRFCSADPVGGQPDDPQTWNRYPYSRNDPINLTDPSGKFFGFLIALFMKLIGWIVSALAHISVAADGFVIHGSTAAVWTGEVIHESVWTITIPYGGLGVGALAIQQGNGGGPSHTGPGPGLALNPPLPKVRPPLCNTTLPGLGHAVMTPGMDNLVSLWQANNAVSGINVSFTSAFRTVARQATLHADPTAITPATWSLHEAGWAADINTNLLTRAQLSTVVSNAQDSGLDWGGNFAHPDPRHFFHDPTGSLDERKDSHQPTTG